jgi:hypothetical protein
VDDVFVFAKLGDELHDAVPIEKGSLLRGLGALVIELDGEAGVEEGELAEAGGEAVELKDDGIDEDRGVWEKGDGGAGFLGISVADDVERLSGFAALEAGADGLKLFPAEQIGPTALKAWRAVFPKEVPFIPVGGITPDTMASFVAAGASGFGLGSSLYRPGQSSEQVLASAAMHIAAWRDCR